MTKTKYCRVRISATSKEEANIISKTLVRRKLVAGTMIYSGNCHYWWEKNVVERKYWNIGAFSVMKNKEKIIKEVKKLHSDKCPIVTFNIIDGNVEFLEWIQNSVK